MAFDIGDDIIDSRDIVERIAEIQGELEDDDLSTDDRDNLTDELASLLDAVSQIDSYGGDQAKDGGSLILDSYFETYAQELADDIGAIDRNAGWPLTYIDWEAAAEALQIDYTTVEIDGFTYWFR